MYLLKSKKGFSVRRSFVLFALFVFIISFLSNTQVFAQDNSPEFDAIFIGDQHVLEMQKFDKDEKNQYLGEEGKGLTWLKQKNRSFIDSDVESNSHVFYMIGFNEVKNTYQADAYASYLNAAAKEVIKLGGKAYYVSVNPIDANKYQTDLNPKIDAWNKVMNEKLSKDITFINTNAYLKKEGFETLNNGYLLNEEGNKKLLSFLLKQVGLTTYDEKVAASKPKPQEIKTKNGWGTDKEGKKVYYNENQEIVKNGVYEIEGAKYLLDEKGYYKIGLQQIDGRNYYFNSVGVMKSGWVNEGDHWMLFSEKGPQLYGWQTYGKDIYYIGKDGYRLTGWWNLGTTLHYFNEDGTVGQGITPVEDEVYYFADKGSVKVGWIEESGDKYYFGEGGPMVTGKQIIGGSVYYFGDDGKMYRGLRNENDGIRYYDKDGTMATGFVEIAGVEYKFDDGGLMETGWVTNSKGEKFYFSKEGKLANGIEVVDKEKTLFKNGEISPGWYEVGGQNYYFDENGKMVSDCWKTIDNKEYYFGEDGVYYTGRHRVDGYRCTFSDDGVLEKKSPIWVLPIVIFFILLVVGAVVILIKSDSAYDFIMGVLTKSESGEKKAPKKKNQKQKIKKPNRVKAPRKGGRKK